MKFKNLVKFGIIVSTIVFSFSCTLPIEIVIPKENGVKISSKFKNLSGLSVDSKDNLYFVDNNVIKKLDSNNSLTIIAGKEKPDIYPNLYPIEKELDGDLNTAKFGNIQDVKYIESKKELYFVDSYVGFFTFIRKVTADNKVITILRLNSKEKYFYINNNGIIFYITDINPRKITQLNLDGTTIKKELFFNQKFYSNLLVDFENNIYLLSENTIYKISDKNTKKIDTTPYSYNNIFFDENFNLYIIENQMYYESFNMSDAIESPHHILLHKVPKNELGNPNLSKEISSGKYLKSFLPEFYNYISVNDKTKTLYAQKDNSLFKIKLEK